MIFCSYYVHIEMFDEKDYVIHNMRTFKARSLLQVS